MTFTASNLFVATWFDLGKIEPFHRFKASGGGTLTIVNSLWASRVDAPDDNYCIDYTAVVVKDTAGSAPQGEMQRLNAFAGGTYTVDTAFSAAVASGDTIAISNADIPLMEMYAAANRALQDMGDVQNVDATLVLSTASDRYTLPTGTKMDFPIRVEYSDGTIHPRIEVPNWRVTADGYLWIPYVEPGTVYLTYVGPHAELTTYNSQISEDLHPSGVIAATTAKALQWLNGAQGGSTPYSLQRENKAMNDQASFEVKSPTKKLTRGAKWFVRGA